MATSKLNKDDAQEWLESLQQVGEGWYRQVALAVRANAHKALGMERREFAQAIGQRMIDPREAILELHREGHTNEAIADILGISKNTSRVVLIEEGLIEPRSIGSGKTSELRSDRSQETVIDGDAVDLDRENEQLRAEVDRLASEIKGAEVKRKREVDEYKQKVKDLRASITEERRKAQQEIEVKLTAAERERAQKEVEAWAEDQAQKVMAGLSQLLVGHITSALQEATGDLREMINQGAVTAEAINTITAVHGGFVDELNVAGMSVQLEAV